MLTRALLALLIVSASVGASVRSFDGVEWKVDSTRYDATLYWQLEPSVTVSFYKQAGLPVEFRLSAPNLIEKANNATLFIMSSPLKAYKNKEPVGELIKSGRRLSDGREITFVSDVPRLLDAMAKGDWGVVELQMPSGVQNVLEIPAIDFIQPLQEFNNRRSVFPLLGWEQGKEYAVQFDVAGYALGQDQKDGLKDLVDLIAYDGEVTSIEIDGHTDLTGHRLNNLTLSQQRAGAVQAYLLELGVDAGLITAVRHHGQRYPIPGASHQENRRVEVRLFR
ncbi:OmpA family protein [Endozoicomonas lisbonensis]|uniref:Outer membrane protein OmpA-like peptidoglycan-associated protein n=1 Tax=Endozoicomonas lisbonensis TaxID=3120522 RepID=A0ABV2SBN3_9GAMM